MKRFIIWNLRLKNTFKAILLASFIILNSVSFIPSARAAGAASLALSPATGTFNKGCTFSVDIVLDTGGSQVDGVDVILFYDPTRFSATGIRSGTVFADYPGNTIDPQAGKLTVSGLASAASPYNGKGVLASIDFKVLDNAPTGIVQMKFDFDPNDKAKSNDSNIAEHATVADILTQVTDGSYTVGTGAACNGGSGGGRGGTVSTPSGNIEQPVVVKAPPKELEKTADFQTTMVVAVVGSILTVLGIIGLAIL